MKNNIFICFFSIFLLQVNWVYAQNCGFSIGGDASICSGESATLSIPGLSPNVCTTFNEFDNGVDTNFSTNGNAITNNTFNVSAVMADASSNYIDIELIDDPGATRFVNLEYSLASVDWCNVTSLEVDLVGDVRALQVFLFDPSGNTNLGDSNLGSNTFTMPVDVTLKDEVTNIRFRVFRRDVVDLVDVGGVVRFGVDNITLCENSIQWLPTMESTASITVSPSNTFTYSAIVQTNCCVDTLTQVVSVSPGDAKAYAISANCVDGVAQNDGYIQIADASSGDRYAYSTGATFTGDPDYNNATAIGATPFIILDNIANPAAATNYTVRIFGSADGCFKDVTVTLETQNCVAGCDCTDYVYLNEPGGELIHKFGINADGSLTEVISNTYFTWYPGNSVSELPSPHGITSDINGYLYISETESSESNIRRIDCGGNITPVTEFAITNTDITQNMFSIGNTLFNNAGGGPNAWDLCTGESLGKVCFNDAAGNPLPDGLFFDSPNIWGLSYNQTTETIYATSRLRLSLLSGGGSDISDPDMRHLVWAVSKADFEAALANGTCINPLISEGPDSSPAAGDNYTPNSDGSILGIVSDNNGNMYIIKGLIEGGTGGQILKYDANGNFVSASVIDTELGQGSTGYGFYNPIGIVYSATSGYLYVSNLQGIGGEDCVSVFDTDLNWIDSAGVPNPTDGTNGGKGIALTTECCPSINRQVIDQTYCIDNSSSESFLLSELYACEGNICEGFWEEAQSDPTITFNACDDSFILEGTSGCATFTKTSDGIGSTNRCGAFDITINVCFYKNQPCSTPDEFTFQKRRP